MVALVVSFLVLFAGVGACMWVGSKRPPGTPVTWGEAFVGGTVVFGLLVVAYGVVPHQWLTFADTDLLWRADRIVLGVSGSGLVMGQEANTMTGAGRILVNYQAVRDAIAALMYIVFLAGQMWLWAAWQKRGRAKPAVEKSSAFGRPVATKA